MADLADADDVADRLGRDLTSEETVRVIALLADASASIRHHAKQEFTQATSTVWVNSCNGRYRLPQKPVVSVATVVDSEDAAVTFTWTHGQYLVIPNRTGVLKVTYTHGYLEIPDVLIGVACQMVLRALGVDPMSTATTQETVGPFSRTIGSAAAAGGLGLLPTERAIVESFGQQGAGALFGSIPVTPAIP